MTSTNRRRRPRFPTSDVQAELITENERYAGVLLDISTLGVCLRGPQLLTGHGNVTFSRDGAHFLTLPGRVARSTTDCSGDAYVGFEFDNELHPNEIADVLRGNDPGNAEFAVATRDHEEVWQEIRAIQACRTNIFIATIGTIAVTSMTVWGFYLEGILDWPGVCVGMGVTFALFVIGVLSTVEKARAINLRRGFLAALAPYMRGELTFKNYWGWIQFKNCPSECGTLRRAEFCPRGIGLKDGDACRDEGGATAAGLNSHKRLVAGLLDSFVSLTSLLYSALYLIFTCLFAYSLAMSVTDWLGQPVFSLLLSFGSGAVCGIIVIRNWWVAGAFLAGLAFATTGMAGTDSRGVWGLIAVAALGGLLGALAWFLVIQLRALRVGKYSFETNAYAWVVMLEHCNPVPIDAHAVRVAHPRGAWLPGPIRNAVHRILRYNSHETIRKDFEDARTGGDARRKAESSAQVGREPQRATWQPRKEATHPPIS